MLRSHFKLVNVNPKLSPQRGCASTKFSNYLFPGENFHKKSHGFTFTLINVQTFTFFTLHVFKKNNSQQYFPAVIQWSIWHRARAPPPSIHSQSVFHCNHDSVTSLEHVTSCSDQSARLSRSIFKRLE